MADNIVDYMQSKVMIMEQIAHMLGRFEITEGKTEDSFDAKGLKDYLDKGGEFMDPPTIGKDFMIGDLADKLRERGIPCALNRIEKGPGKGLCVLWTRDCDAPYVKSAIEEIKALAEPTKDEYGITMMPVTEVSPYTLKNIAEKENHTITAVYGLDKAEEKVLTENLRTKNVVFAKKEGPDGMDFFFSSADKDKASACLAEVSVTFSGVSGNYRHFEVEAEMEALEQAKEAIDSKKEIVIVSANNPKNLIYIGDKGMTHGIADGSKFSHIYRSVDKDNKDFKLTCKSETMAIKHPVVLSKEEYDKIKDDPERLKKIVNDKHIKPMYENEHEKYIAYVERTFKSAYERSLYQKLRKDELNLPHERDNLKDVKLGDLSIAEFVAGDELSNRELYQLEDMVMGMSNEERETLVDNLEDIIKTHENAKNMFVRHIFNDRELEMEIDETIEQVNIPETTMGIETEVEPMVQDVAEPDIED